MNRALKIILPLLLSIAILFSIGWYFLKYDPTFTQELLVKQARQAEDNGNLSLSTWLYDLAYRQSGKDEAVAIELAQQYRDNGNFTKAEYTLSNAIADGGSVKLYQALCATYVQQNKLLDAVTMLDNVSNQTIKAQLDVLRPAAPTVSHTPGEYSEYISVALDGQGYTVYYSLDGSYPSTKGAVYQHPISLPSGETGIYALTVNEDGLVSPLMHFGYKVAGVIESVTLTDPAIDQAVRQMLQVGEDYALYSNDLWEITSFSVPVEAKTLEDLKWMPHLKQLVMRQTTVESLSPLGSLQELEELIINKQRVTSQDLEIISKLPKLTTLTLSQCSLSAIDSLSAATGITRLDISGNTIQDLTSLESMQELAYVDISNNAVNSLQVFSQKEKLIELYAAHNFITSTEALKDCSSLMVLDLNHNSLSALDGLAQLPALRTLYVSTNHLTDVSSLAESTTLGDLDISSNAITNISALGNMEQLILLDFSNNQVSKLPAFAKEHKLVSINGANNLLTSLEPLRGLNKLQIVNVENNEGISSAASLASCPALAEVNVMNTGVHDRCGISDEVTMHYSPI